jgi:hypothetical protein
LLYDAFSLVGVGVYFVSACLITLDETTKEMEDMRRPEQVAMFVCLFGSIGGEKDGSVKA